MSNIEPARTSCVDRMPLPPQKEFQLRGQGGYQATQYGQPANPLHLLLLQRLLPSPLRLLHPTPQTSLMEVVGLVSALWLPEYSLKFLLVLEGSSTCDLSLT